jgi:hypothetical protein
MSLVCDTKQEASALKRIPRWFKTGSLLVAMLVSGTAFAQKQGGVLKVYQWDSPASMSIHEEATVAAEGPMMGSSTILSYTSKIFRKPA